MMRSCILITILTKLSQNMCSNIVHKSIQKIWRKLKTTSMISTSNSNKSSIKNSNKSCMIHFQSCNSLTVIKSLGWQWLTNHINTPASLIKTILSLSNNLNNRSSVASILLLRLSSMKSHTRGSCLLMKTSLTL